MQNKGALKVLVVLLAIACAYQLSFTFVTRNVEKKAARYAAGDPVKEQNYLDSMKSQTVYNLGVIKFNYKQVKEMEINLGLDLRGGMNVTLQIAVEDVVRALSNNSKDPVFNQAMAQAAEAQKSGSGDFITHFAQAYNELSNGGRLSSIFNTPELRDQVFPTSTNEEVIKVLREQATSAIDNSFNVLRSRIDKFGVTQPNIQKLENGRILVELPGVKEPERVRKLLQGTASLEFWSTYNNQEIYPTLVQINSVIRDLNLAAGTTAGTETEDAGQATDQEIADGANRDAFASQLDSLAGVLTAIENPVGSDIDQMASEFPLFSKLMPMSDGQSVFSGPVIGRAMAYDTATVNKYFNIPQVKALLPRDVKLMWGFKGVDEAGTMFELYAIKANTRDGLAPLDGGAVIEAREEYSSRGGSAEVSMAMNATGARTWARLTADNIGNSIAIVLDGYVYSAPGVSSEITGGRSSITGNFTINEARDLANVLKSGKLPAPARIVQEELVGPSLGAESIRSSMISFVVAFILVLLYMMFFYNKAGLVASVALIANLFFLFGVLVSFGSVLTLPGIAGIVLTMGMAVDANVIIYERVKEELRAGKGLGLSIADGYKNAMSAIIDSNVTTIIVGIVLLIFGTGPVRGFATTLIIGILTSLFCSIFITRLIFSSMLSKDRKITFSNKFTENFLSNTKVNFLKMRKYSYSVVSVLILVSIVSLFTLGLNPGVDFTGGRSYVVRFDQDVAADEVREAIYAKFDEVEGDDAGKSATVKQFGNATQMRIITQYKYDEQGEDASMEVEELLYEALNGLYATHLDLDEFLTTATNPYGIISSDKVGPSVASDITRNSFIAVIFSLIAMATYIIIRFKKWQWGAGSFVGLTIDAFLTIGAFSLLYKVLPFSMEIDQAFIAAILTIIGYSINDKVVIFDRIREYHTLYPKRNDFDNINNAINSTLSRTVNTSGTTLVTLLAIFLFGGDVIRGFIFALLIGIILGTLSSIFIATPVAYDLIRKAKKKTA